LLPEWHLRPEMFPHGFGRSRYFVPFFPMPMLLDFPLESPIGVKDFFSKWGLAVIKSELQWIWLPSFMVVVLSTLIRGLVARQ